jgi:A/G-specific adenine glycosylase
MAQSVVPPENAYAWNQALMDLGATLCRAQRPLCLVCPLVVECGGPQPIRSSKSTTPRFTGSRRFHRGRILDELRRAETVAIAELGQPELIERMVSEGLLEVDSQGYARLPR